MEPDQFPVEFQGGIAGGKAEYGLSRCRIIETTTPAAVAAPASGLFRISISTYGPVCKFLSVLWFQAM